MESKRNEGGELNKKFWEGGTKEPNPVGGRRKGC